MSVFAKRRESTASIAAANVRSRPYTATMGSMRPSGHRGIAASYSPPASKRASRIFGARRGWSHPRYATSLAEIALAPVIKATSGDCSPRSSSTTRISGGTNDRIIADSGAFDAITISWTTCATASTTRRTRGTPRTGRRAFGRPIRREGPPAAMMAPRTGSAYPPRTRSAPSHVLYKLSMS